MSSATAGAARRRAGRRGSSLACSRPRSSATSSTSASAGSAAVAATRPPDRPRSPPPERLHCRRRRPAPRSPRRRRRRRDPRRGGRRGSPPRAARRRRSAAHVGVASSTTSATGRLLVPRGDGATVDPGVDHQAGHRRGRARVARPGPRRSRPASSPGPRRASWCWSAAATRPGRARRQAGAAVPGARRRSPTLAAQTAAALCSDEGRAAVRLGFDDSLFTGPPLSPGWPATTSRRTWSSPDHRAVGRRRPDRRQLRPRRRPVGARRAARSRAALAPAGITGRPAHRRRTAPAGGAAELGSVSQRAAGRARRADAGRSATTRSPRCWPARSGWRPRAAARSPAGAAAVPDVLRGSASTRAATGLYDGSGLSRARPAHPGDAGPACCGWPPRADHPELRAVAHRAAGRRVHRHAGATASRAGPPAAVAGCAPRPARSPGYALAGIVRDADGRLLVFAVVADRVAAARRTVGARAALDCARRRPGRAAAAADRSAAGVRPVRSQT